MMTAAKLGVDWDSEITVLEDMSMTAGRAHVIAAEALVIAINAVEPEYAALDQKLLTAKLAAESIAALETLGALVWAIRNRAEAGVLRSLLDYKPFQVREMYEYVMDGMPINELLQVPTVAQLAPYMVEEDDQTAYSSTLASLEVALLDVAEVYLDKSPSRVVTYNKVKHGFMVLIRLDKLRPSTAPPGDWRNDVNVITGVDLNGSVRYTVIPRTSDRILNFVDCIKLHAQTYRAIVDLVLLLWQRGVPIDWNGNGTPPQG